MSLFANFFGQQKDEDNYLPEPVYFPQGPTPNTDMYGSLPLGHGHNQDSRIVYTKLPRQGIERTNRPYTAYTGHQPVQLPAGIVMPNRQASKNELQNSQQGSMCEGKDEVHVPVLSLEGSKGSQMMASSWNSHLSKLSQHNSRHPGSSVRSDKPESQPSDRIKPCTQPTRSMLEQDLTLMSQKLIKYIRLNDEERSSKIINRKLANLDYRGDNDWAALHFVCWAGNSKLLNLLLLNHASVNLEAKNGLTPLMVVCKVGNHYIFSTLIAAGANCEQEDHGGNTCLHYAAQGGNTHIVSELLEFGVPPEKANSQGRYPEDCTTDPRLHDVLKQKRESKEGFFVPIFSYTFDKIKNIFSSDEPINRQVSPVKVWPNDFDILCILGKGSFGQVFLVRKKDTGVKYAMKVLLKAKVLSRFAVIKAKIY